VLGNATQDTLGNLFSGLALNTESPFMIGDWVQIAGNTGRIVDMTWRATCLRTKTDDYVIIPNAAIAREAIINYSRPTEVHGYLLDVGVSYDVAPNKLRQVVMEVLGSVDEVLKTPSPCVWLVKYNDFSIDYKIKFYIRDFARLEHVQSRIMDLIWYHFKRNDITIPFPIRNIYMRHIKPEEEVQEVQAKLVNKNDILSGIDIFKPLSDAERQILAEAMREEIYAVGEEILHQGDEGSSFYVIRSGSVDVFVLRDGRKVKVARLTAGSFFGEMSFMTGERCNATIKAGSDCVIEVLSHDVLGGILESNSRLAEEFAIILGERTRSSQDSFAEDNRVHPVIQSLPPDSSSDILKRIRNFFSLD
jgi:CRP-like cAMP-binding protein